MSKFENKLVAVMNKSVEPGKMLNALAHMCIGFGAHLGTDKLQLLDEKRERFSHFTHEQVTLALKDSKFDFNWVMLLSDEQLAAVPLSELSTGTFNRMFAYNIDLDEKRERFSHFTHEQVNLALKDSKFDFSRANSNKCYCVLSRSLEA